MEKQYKPVPDVECLKYHGTPEKPDIKIFVSHRIDLDAEIIDNPLYIPVRCGAVYDEREGVTMLGDDTGDNVSTWREKLCELTVQYWAWKNVEADYYGLCHYRRYFSFGQRQETDCFGNVVCDYLSAENKKKFCLEDTKIIEEQVRKYDVIATNPFIVTKGLHPVSNLFEQYVDNPTMHRKDLDTALDVLKEMHPEHCKYAREYFEQDKFYPDNLFIMKKEIFRSYCKWLFPILFETDKRLNYKKYSQEEMRAIGMIGERMLGVYLLFLQRTNSKIKIGYFQRVIFFQPKSIAPLLPYPTPNNIPVVFASSNHFIPYTAISMYSMLKNADSKYHYDLVILTSDVEPYMEKNLRLMLEDFPNCHLRIWDVSPYVAGKKFLVNGAHVSKETFYRLLIPDLFYNYERIIYLDSDLIIQGDISKLYTLPMGENLVAAAIDVDFIGEYKGGIATVKKYCDKTLRLKEPYKYFQAGVMVFNVKEMTRKFKREELVDYALSKSFLYVDQDVLNVKCAGRVYNLDLRWNVMTDCASIRIKQFISKAPIEEYKKYLEVRKDPAIIHYAGFEKPWNSPLSDFANIFWQYARKTLFYESIIYRMHDDMRNSITDLQWRVGYYDFRSAPRKFADKMLPPGTRRRKAVDVLFPPDSKRRGVLKAIYYFFKPQYRPAKVKEPDTEKEDSAEDEDE